MIGNTLARLLSSLWRISLVLLVSLFSLAFSQSAAAGIEVPNGFVLIRSSVGVQLYRKDYPSGYPDYVQVIRLERGAEVRLLHGKISHQGVTSGVYGGLDARFQSRSILQYWEEILSTTSRAFCVTNGQFFYMYEYPTRLPFPLKVNGRVVSGGYSKGEFTDQKYMLELWKDHADIRPLTKVDFQKSDAPNIVTGLAEDARKSPEKYVGRTFAGVADQNRDGVYETLLIFSTQAARQRDAAETLRKFGAEKVMMLDGGLSTQLVCQGNAYIQTERLIPQAIAVLDGTTPFVKRLPAKPTPVRPQPEMNQVHSQGQEVVLSEPAVIPSSSEELFEERAALPTATLNAEQEKEEPVAVHPTDVLLIPIPILLISLFFVGIFRRLWMRA